MKSSDVTSTTESICWERLNQIRDVKRTNNEHDGTHLSGNDLLPVNDLIQKKIFWESEQNQFSFFMLSSPLQASNSNHQCVGL